MRTRKYFTVREWNRFKNNDYFDMQDMLCQKYDVILTDYKTKREKVFSVLKKINLRNFDKGVTEFSKLVQSFGGSMDQLTSQINSPKSKDADNFDSQYQDNLEKIWGKRKWDVKFVRILIKIPQDQILGKNKCADFVV